MKVKEMIAELAKQQERIKELESDLNGLFVYLSKTLIPRKGTDVWVKLITTTEIEIIKGL